MKVFKILRSALWGDKHIDFYITDEEFDRVAKVTYTEGKKVYMTVVKSVTGKMEESSPLELLVLTGLHRGDIESIVQRTPR